jgi:hypothetical protein
LTHSWFLCYDDYVVNWHRKNATRFSWGVCLKPPRWILTAALGVIAGMGFWLWTAPSKSESGMGAAPAPDKAPIPDLNAPGNPMALRYAAAFQQGSWDEIVDMTCWMQQRLTRVQIETGSAAARQEARAALARRVCDRKVEGNRLRPEGIEDQYVFAGDAKIEPAGLDAGRPNLEQPTKDRTWIRVTYPLRRTALRDDKGIPIRSIVAGINVSTGDLVLKANVIGNLDIDRRSISYDWKTDGGSLAE